MKVPLQDLAELRATVFLAAARDQAPEMPAHQVDPFFESRIGARPPGPAPAVELAKKKGVGQRPPADRDCRATGLLERGRGIGDRSDVAIGDDRYAIDGFDYGANARAAHGPLEPLLPGSTVY